MRRILISSFLGLLLPSIAFAQVQITEVMYDLPGSDSKGEWIEITNTGSGAIDLTNYKLFEGGVNHKLVTQGSPVLLPEASAVIVEDPATFNADWPQFAAAIFDSAFSLSNTGEALVIKDASSTIVDSISYSSAMGANGDGASLHKNGQTFIEALPTPGVFPGALVPVAKKEVVSATPTKKSPTSQTKTSSSTPVKKISSTPPVNSELAAASALMPVLPWLLGLGVIIVLGALGAFFIKPVTNHTKEEFEIINDEQ